MLALVFGFVTIVPPFGTRQLLLFIFISLSGRPFILDVSYVILGAILCRQSVSSSSASDCIFVILVSHIYMLNCLLFLNFVHSSLCCLLHVRLHTIVNVCSGSEHAIIQQIVVSS